MRCDRCDAEAVIDQPYRRAHLCSEHFRESVDERVRRDMHRQLPRFAGGTVAVALSGGKDSAVALSEVHRYFSRRHHVRLVAVTVDEGIEGYRSWGVAQAERLTATLGMEHRVVRASERLGITTDRAVRSLPGVIPCSYCGVWRRRLLNDVARQEQASVLVLGFNLDDLAQTVLMNFARADIDHLVRMAPHRTRQPGLVPRIAPLASIPEREVYLYAHLRKLPFDHGECPHAAHAARNVYREVVWRLEEAQPGTRHALVRARDRLVELLQANEDPGTARRCATCGEPSTGPQCRSCAYLARVLTSVMPAAGS